MSELTIRASEIAQFLFCRRAWWYARSGHPPDDNRTLLEGDRWHHQHARSVLLAGCLRTLGAVFVLASLVMAAIYLTSRLVG